MVGAAAPGCHCGHHCAGLRTGAHHRLLDLHAIHLRKLLVDGRLICPSTRWQLRLCRHVAVVWYVHASPRSTKVIYQYLLYGVDSASL